MKTLVPLILIAAGLAGCGASEVTVAGPSTYRVVAQEGLPSGGWPTAQQEALAKANQYCTSKGQSFSLVDQTQSGTPGFTLLSSAVTFTCGVDHTQETKALVDQCASDMQAPEFEPLRAKIQLYRDSFETPPPFEISANETFPTADDLPLIAKWATARDHCIGQAANIPITGANPLNTAFLQQDRAFGTEAGGRVGELVVALYHGKLTFGEFARKRYEITRDAGAAERQFRTATLIADHERQVQAQQAAQQQFQSNLVAWSAYMQAVNARQPTVPSAPAYKIPTRTTTDTNCSKIGNQLNCESTTH